MALVRHRLLLRHHNDDRVRLLALLSIAHRQAGQHADAVACLRECDGLTKSSGRRRTDAGDAKLCVCGVQGSPDLGVSAQLALDRARNRKTADGGWALWALARAQLKLGQTQRATVGLESKR